MHLVSAYSMARSRMRVRLTKWVQRMGLALPVSVEETEEVRAEALGVGSTALLGASAATPPHM